MKFVFFQKNRTPGLHSLGAIFPKRRHKENEDIYNLPVVQPFSQLYQSPHFVKIYRKEWESTVQAPIEDVWNFFSSPENLARLTPASVGFEMLTEMSGQKMYTGMFVSHRVRPIAGIPLIWTSEITHISEGSYFVDEQRSGPYALWHHEHHFRAESHSATVVHDILHYAMPLGIIGQMAHALFVEKMINGIFEHRELVIHGMF